MLLPLLGDYDLSALRMILCGGSAVPKSLSEAYKDALGFPILHAWGMTETSPIATISSPRSYYADLDEGQRADTRARQGQPVPLVDLRIVDPGSGEAQPWDDTATGEVQAAGPWIANEYYRGEGGGAQFTDDGWLRTGDVAAVDRYGNFRLVDRTKDLIKSGGEWIGSVELENEIMAHPKVAEAAVIAIPQREVGRAAAGLRGREGGREPHGRRGPRAPAAAGGEVVAARRRRVHRRGAEDERGQVLEEDAPRQVHRVPGVQLTRPKRAFTSGNSSGRPPRPLWVSGVGRRSVGVSAEQETEQTPPRLLHCGRFHRTPIARDNPDARDRISWSGASGTPVSAH